DPDDQSFAAEPTIEESARSSVEPAVDQDALSLLTTSLSACHGTTTCPNNYSCDGVPSGPMPCGVKSCSVTCLNGRAIASLQPQEVATECHLIGASPDDPNYICIKWAPTLAKKTCK